MTKMLSVAVVVGTRPEIIRLSATIKLLSKHTRLTLVHTGQNYDYELNQIFFDDLSISRPDYFLNSAENSLSSVNTVSNIIASSYLCFEKIKPEAVLLLGDTNSCLSAYSAKRLKIPIFHMEAGNRCFDMRVPEEINRRLVDTLADFNLPYSQIARQYLLSEGFPPDRIVVTGSPMKEVLSSNLPAILASSILDDLCVSPRKYFLVSVHREENVSSSESIQKLISVLNYLAVAFEFPVIVSTHPRTRQALDELAVDTLDSRVKLMKPLGFFDYNNLQINSFAVLSDSGTITEESSLLGFNALNLRECHERPEGMEHPSAILTGFNRDRISQALAIFESSGSSPLFDSVSSSVVDYNDSRVSEKILKIIHSYVDYVNRSVWRK